jgi:integrase/recombinase XerC
VLGHTFARDFLERGGDLPALQEMLGHANLSSTQVYTRPRSDRLAELAENVRIEA